MMAALTSAYSMKDLEETPTVVGDEYCIACHSWSAITHEVKHRKALRKPQAKNTLINGKGVVADYDKNGVDDFMQGLDFNQINSVFDPYKPNAPILGFANNRYTITIGEMTVWVVITQGGTGDWKQRYLVRAPVTGTGTGWTKDNYVSPCSTTRRLTVMWPITPSTGGTPIPWSRGSAPSLRCRTSRPGVAAIPNAASAATRPASGIR